MQKLFTSHRLSELSLRHGNLIVLRRMLICIFMITFALPLYAQKTSISISLSGVTVKKVIEAVKAESGYSFWYRDSDIDLTRKVNVNAKNENVLVILNKVLAEQKLSAKIEGKHIVIFRIASKNLTQRVSGVVKTAGGQAVVGASVVVKGTTQGAITDLKGAFSMDVQPAQTLLISFIGYTPQEITVGHQTQIAVTLEDDVQQIDNVVVIGYGTAKKVNLTGSISVMDMAKQENQPLSNASAALHTIPGLYVNQASSKPGNDGATIRIRGVGTLSGCNPLILVDGMEYNLNEINPENIATVTVLKDASASIYGSKAANGVILITTKTGKKGAPKLSLSANIGFQTPTYIPDVVTNPIQYMELRNKAVMNEGSNLIGDYSQAEINEYKEGMKHDKYIYPSSDWYDLCYDTGMIQQYNARLSGGTDIVTYSIAAGFMDQQGIFINNDAAQRYSWDLKMAVKASKRLTIGANILGNYRENTEPCYTTQTTASTISRALPIMSGILPGGEYGSSWLSTPGRNNYENPLMQLYEGGIQRRVQRFIGKLTLEYVLPFNIKYNANLGYEKEDNYSKNHVPAMYTYNPKTMEKKNFNSHVPRVKDYDSNGLNITFYNTLSWDKTFAKAHTLSAMVGTEYKRNNYKGFQAYAEDFFNNQLTDLDAGTTFYKSTGLSKIQILSSYFARVGYDYKQRYLLDVTARYDGSSKFAKGNQWSFFPSVSFGWRLDRENFMQNVHDINLLKIRGSWGKMGNQAIGDYEYLMSVITGQSNYSFGNAAAPGAAITDFVDPSISWETTTSYNLGLDLNMYNNRLSFSTDVYKKRTTGILRTVDIPAQVGNLVGPMRNIGVVDNTGIEIVANWKEKRGDFTYSIGGSFAYNQNMVIDLKGEEIPSSFCMTKEGYAINSWWLYQADGYYQTQQEVDNSVTMSNKVKPGYIKLVNQNGDEILDTQDKIIAGNSVPTITYAFNFSVGWKGLDLSAQFQGVADVSAYLSGNIAAPLWNGAGITKDWLTDSWSPENPHSKLPLLTTATGATEMYNGAVNTHWLYDASYLRLKNLQLSYNLPEKWLKKINIERAQFFVNGHNLFTFSPMKMFDPEKNITSTNIMEYPSLKTYNVGFNFMF